MKIKQCPKCLKNRVNNSPVSYVWWAVQGHGHMCWHCFDKLKKKNHG
jgi:hypothetical protein